jgi:hypothetical protein
MMGYYIYKQLVFRETVLRDIGKLATIIFMLRPIIVFAGGKPG